MNKLTLITQLISALAWPVTVLVCVLLLRPFLARLVPLIRTVKYSDVEVQFGREVADLKATAVSIQPASIESRQQPIWEDLIRLAATRPRTAVSRAWQQVELALMTAAKKHALDLCHSLERCRHAEGESDELGRVVRVEAINGRMSRLVGELPKPAK